MAGALGIGGNPTEWTKEELDQAWELIAVYKQIRPVIQRARVQRTSSHVDPDRGRVSGQALVSQGIVMDLPSGGYASTLIRLRSVRRVRVFPDTPRFSALSSDLEP